MKKTVNKQTLVIITRQITAIQHGSMPGFVTVAGEHLLSDKFTLTKKKKLRRGRTK